MANQVAELKISDNCPQKYRRGAGATQLSEPGVRNGMRARGSTFWYLWRTWGCGGQLDRSSWSRRCVEHSALRLPWSRSAALHPSPGRCSGNQHYGYGSETAHRQNHGRLRSRGSSGHSSQPGGWRVGRPQWPHPRRLGWVRCRGRSGDECRWCRHKRHGDELLHATAVQQPAHLFPATDTDTKSQDPGQQHGRDGYANPGFVTGVRHPLDQTWHVQYVGYVPNELR